MIKIVDNHKKAIICIGLAFLVLILYHMFSNNLVLALSKYGSRGSEVSQIQTKLKRGGIIKEISMGFMEARP